jgi:hypothetical protein
MSGLTAQDVMVLFCALGYYAELPALQEDGQAAGRVQGGAVLPAKVLRLFSKIEV